MITPLDLLVFRIHRDEKYNKRPREDAICKIQAVGHSTSDPVSSTECKKSVCGGRYI